MQPLVGLCQCEWGGGAVISDEVLDALEGASVVPSKWANVKGIE